MLANTAAAASNPVRSLSPRRLTMLRWSEGKERHLLPLSLLLCLLSFFPPFLICFLWAFVLRCVHPFRLSTPIPSFWFTFFLSCVLSISLSFSFLYVIFFLPIFNCCFRHHPRDDSDCNELAGSWGPPFRYPAVCNSVLVQQTTEIK